MCYLAVTQSVAEWFKDLDLWSAEDWGLNQFIGKCIVPSLCQTSRLDYDITSSRMRMSCEWTYNVHALLWNCGKMCVLWLQTVKYATYQKWHHGLSQNWTECRLEQRTSTHSTSSWSWSSIGYLLYKQTHSELGVATHLRNTTKYGSLAR